MESCVFLKENEQRKHNFHSVQATDKDDSDRNNFGKVQYRIVNSDSMSTEKFAIKKETGAVIVGSHLTDTSGTFKLEIEAFDNMVRKDR